MESRIHYFQLQYFLHSLALFFVQYWFPNSEYSNPPLLHSLLHTDTILIPCPSQGNKKKKLNELSLTDTLNSSYAYIYVLLDKHVCILDLRGSFGMQKFHRKTQEQRKIPAFQTGPEKCSKSTTKGDIYQPSSEYSMSTSWTKWFIRLYLLYRYLVGNLTFTSYWSTPSVPN